MDEQMPLLTLDQLKANVLVEVEVYRETAQAYAAACERAAKADHEYRQRQAREYHSIAAEDEASAKKRTEAHRQALVEKLCDTEQLRQRLAVAEREGMKARMEASATAVSAYQSLLKLEGEEVKMANYSGT